MSAFARLSPVHTACRDHTAVSWKRQVSGSSYYAGRMKRAGMKGLYRGDGRCASTDPRRVICGVPRHDYSPHAVMGWMFTSSPNSYGKPSEVGLRVGGVRGGREGDVMG